MVLALDLTSLFLGFAAGSVLALCLAWFLAGKLTLVRQMEKDARALARHCETQYAALRSKLAEKVIGAGGSADLPSRSAVLPAEGSEKPRT